MATESTESAERSAESSVLTFTCGCQKAGEEITRQCRTEFPAYRCGCVKPFDCQTVQKFRCGLEKLELPCGCIQKSRPRECIYFTSCATYEIVCQNHKKAARKRKEELAREALEDAIAGARI
jgi:hypothetical protein